MQDLYDFYSYLPKVVVDAFTGEEAEVKIIGNHRITIFGKYDGEILHGDSVVAFRKDGRYKKVVKINNIPDYYYKHAESSCTVYVNDSISIEMFDSLPDTTNMTFKIIDIAHMEILTKSGKLKGKTIEIMCETPQTVNLDCLSCKILKVKNVIMMGKSDCMTLISFNNFSYKVSEEKFPNLLYTNLIAKHAIIHLDNEIVINKEHPKYSPKIFLGYHGYLHESIENCGKHTLKLINRVNAKSARKL